MTNEEINKRIHLEVIGGCSRTTFSFGGIVSTSENCKDCGKPLIAEHYQHTNPNYCESISDAWKVVEKIHSSGSMVSVSGSDETGEWWMTIYPPKGLHVDGDYAPTAPMAICLAALEVVGENYRHG